MRHTVIVVLLGVFFVADSAFGQTPQSGTYACSDRRRELFVGECFGNPLRCNLRVFEDGRERPGGILPPTGIDEELTRCLGAGAPKTPTRKDPPEPRRAPAGQPPATGSAAGRGPATPSDASGLPPSADPGTEAARRCVASGRSLVDCIGVAFGTGLAGTPLAPGSQPAGLRVNGGYRNGKAISIMFLPRGTATASVSWSCGIESETYSYSVRLAEGQTAVVLETQPQPVTFTLAANGTLVGPESMLVNGRVVVGHQPGVRTYPDGRTEPITRPVYEPRTVRCPIGTLTATGEAAPPEQQTATAPLAFSAQALGLDTAAQQAAQTKEFKAAAGMRVLGTYRDATGSSVEFRSDSATVNCGNVSVAQSYTVATKAGQMVITLANQPAAIVLTVGRDGTLTGPGALSVAGRVMTGMNGGQVTFAPSTGRCTLGLLRP